MIGLKMSINNLNFLLGPKGLFWSGDYLTACLFYENALKSNVTWDLRFRLRWLWKLLYSRTWRRIFG